MNEEKGNLSVTTQAKINIGLTGTMTKQGADRAGGWIAVGIFALLLSIGLAITAKALFPNGLPIAHPTTQTGKNTQ